MTGGRRRPGLASRNRLEREESFSQVPRREEYFEMSGFVFAFIDFWRVFVLHERKESGRRNAN